MTKKKLPENVINPFSDNFLETWDLWKRFKKEEFGFQYKGVISEQVALMNLKIVSNNDEETAIMVIQQSIGERWKGLFPLIDKYKKNKNGGQQSSNNAEKSSYRDSVKEEFNKRYGGGQQTTN
jgi:hypothetical protein